MSDKKGLTNLDSNTLEQLPLAVILFDAKRIYFLNNKAKKILGLVATKFEKVQELNLFDYIADKHKPLLKTNITKVMNGSNFDSIELELINHKGKPLQIEIKSNRAVFNGKQVCQATFFDVSNRKKQEEELADAFSLLESLSSYSRDVIFKFDLYPKPTCVFISDGVKDLVGYEPSFFYKSLTGIKRIVFEEDYAPYITSTRAFITFYKKLNGNKSIITRWKHKNGSTLYVELLLNLVFDAKNQLVSIIGNCRNVSDKLQIEKLLSESKERFELLANNSNDIIHFFTYFPKPRYLYVSPNVGKILGYTPQDFYNDPSFYTKHLKSNADDFKQIEEKLRLIQQKSTNINFTYTFQTTKADGDFVWLENNLVPIFGENGKTKMFLNVLRDITTQKIHEQELNRKSNDYEQLLNTAPMACVIHHQGSIGYCNDAVLAILQTRDRKKLLGKFLVDMVVEKDRRRLVNDISRRVKKSIKTAPAHYKFRTFKDHIIEVSIQSKPIQYNGKNGILSVIENITERKQIEKQQLRSEVVESTNKLLVKEIDERSKIEEKLIDQTARLKAVFESSSHLVWTVNHKLEITSFNSNFYNVIKDEYAKHIEPGISVNELLSGPKGELHANFWFPKYKRALAGESLEFENETFDETQHVFRKIHINPILNKNGRINEISCIASDITEAKLYERQIIEQSGRLQAIFESGNQLMWSVNKKIELTNYNQNYYNAIFELHGIYPQIGKTVYYDSFKKKEDPYANAWDKRYEEVFKGKSLDFITDRELSDGSIIYRQIYLQPIIGNNNEVIEASGIAYDITDKIQSEQKIKNQTAKLKAIFESGNQFIWTVNKDYRLTSFNKEFSQTIYDIFSFYPILNTDPYTAYPPDKVELFLGFWHSKYEEVFKGKAINFVSQRANMDGSMRYRQIYLNPIYSGNTVTEVAGVGFDITDKVLSEQKISNQAAKLNAIFDSSMHYIWTVDIFLKLTSFNKNYFDLIKTIYNTQPYLGFQLNRGILASDKGYVSLIEANYKEAFTGVPKNFELELADKFGNKMYLEVFLNPIFDGSAVIEVSGIAYDITDKKTSQEKIVQSLREKEVLLKEVHHRVKNNMQVISSILNLQSSYVSDEYALSLLKESQNRIKTMAYIHESLYQNKTFATIDFSDYIATLSSNIIQSYAVSTDKVKLILNISKVVLGLDVSIPAGLIINELVTNSIKHAFNDGKTGFLSINLKSQNNTVILDVVDNGIGLPDNFDYRNTNSLGLQLVNTLVEQIDGTVEFKNRASGGTEVNITFPI